MELALDDYSPLDVVESVRTSLRSLAAEKGLDFVDPRPGRPAVGLRRRAAHLAVPHEPGRQRAEVHAARVGWRSASRSSGDELVYRVADTGIGIPRQDLENVFSEFRQVDATITREFGGTGLGLSITKKFVELHGGRIGVESELAKGSTFLFSIPLRRARAVMKQRNVLYVEDNEYNRKIVRQLLSRTAYRLVEAGDGEAALAMVRQELPDLVLMDVQLPKMSGFDVTRTLRAEAATATIPIIMVTSFALSGDDQRAMAAGASAYLAKPYSPRELLALVRKFLPEN